MSSIKSTKSLTLDLPPSCIEFWPHDPQYAVVGTYNLEKQDEHISTENQDADEEEKKRQRRNGSLILVQVENGNVSIIHTLSTPSAILDVHFGPRNIPVTIFGVATSTGSIGIYELRRDNQRLGISHIRTIQYFPEDVLVTAFAWHPKGSAIGATLSSGQVCLGKFDIGNDTEAVSADVLTHDLEAWTLAFHLDGSGLYSGGDDSALRFAELAVNVGHYFDGSVEQEFSDTRRIPWRDQRIHGAGVTAILPLHSTEEADLVITGSYDDHIRLVYAPLTGRKSILAETNLGGGVWRLKVLNKKLPLALQQGNLGPENVLLLVSCMHAGTRIVKLARDESKTWSFEILARFEEHKSMNYGSDAQPEVNREGQYTFVTTSFYDRLLCLWRF